MNQHNLDEKIVDALRVAFEIAHAAPVNDPTSDPDQEGDHTADGSISPQATSATALSELASQARLTCLQYHNRAGEIICGLLADTCYYLVDPELRPQMLEFADHCLKALENIPARSLASEADALHVRFTALKPAENDAAAIARALGMTEEEARDFGLIGRLTAQELGNDDEDIWADGDQEDDPDESLDVIFCRNASEIVASSLPQALRRYWKQQDNMLSLLEVRRAFHTLKGDAAVAAQHCPEAEDLTGFSTLAEAAEDIIDELLGDDTSHDGPAPTLPAGAYRLLGEAQEFLRLRLEARAALPEEPALLTRLTAMQTKSRAKRQGASTNQEQLLADTSRSPKQQGPALSKIAATSSAKRTRQRSAPDQQALITHTFLSEADKLIDDVHRALARLADSPGDEHALIRARVKLHTLKGSAALAGPLAAPIERVAHACEDVLELIEDAQLRGTLDAIPAQALDAVFDAEDTIGGLLASMRQVVDGHALTSATPYLPPPAATTALLERLAAIKVQITSPLLIVSETSSPPIEKVPDSATALPSRALQIEHQTYSEQHGPEPNLMPSRPGSTPADSNDNSVMARSRDEDEPELPFNDAYNDANNDAYNDAYEDGDTQTERSLHTALRALEDQQISGDAQRLLLHTMSGHVGDALNSGRRLQELVERVASELAGLHRQLVNTTRRSGGWDALEKEEYTTIDVLLMQLDEALADQQDAQLSLHRELGEAYAQNDIQNDSLLRAQHALLDMSMIPLSEMEARLDHAVRSVARRLNKRVVFELDGGDITLDSHSAELLFNPLMLLINNAIDHGIEERAADRVAAGKPAHGRIALRARSDGNTVTLQLTDDGRGIDPDRLVAVAINKGVVEAAQAAAMTRQERVSLIWRPGFSTARQISSISGRGMGMQSVHDNIATMHGHIDVTTETDPMKGSGTTFTITLPRSLSMMRVLIVREGPHLAATPIADIVTTHAVPYPNVNDYAVTRQVHSGSRTCNVASVHLAHGPAGDGLGGQGIFLEIANQTEGIVVDEVVRSQYLPVRPTPPYLRRLCGVTGYALGPGGVILPIIDLHILLQRAATAQAALRIPQLHSGPPAGYQHTALVVDDSQTMRRALSRTFRREGFKVREAANGREALAMVGRELPDIITLDMEMPEMDGLETLAALRLMPGGAKLPIFMITSRQQTHHRAAALAAGVTRYFTKPYDDGELLGAAHLVIAENTATLDVAS